MESIKRKSWRHGEMRGFSSKSLYWFVRPFACASSVRASCTRCVRPNSVIIDQYSMHIIDKISSPIGPESLLGWRQERPTKREKEHEICESFPSSFFSVTLYLTRYLPVRIHKFVCFVASLQFCLTVRNYYVDCYIDWCVFKESFAFWKVYVTSRVVERIQVRICSPYIGVEE